jgi:hypothetical protein
MRSLGSSVSIVTRLRAVRPRNCDSICGCVRAFPPLRHSDLLWPTHIPYQWILWAISSGAKWLWSEADHRLPSTEEAKNGWIFTTTSPYSVLLYGVRREKFTCIDIIKAHTCIYIYMCVCVCVCVCGESVLLARIYGGLWPFWGGVKTGLVEYFCSF